MLQSDAIMRFTPTAPYRFLVLLRLSFSIMSAAMVFMHGAQDGKKFMAVFLLGAAFAGGQADTAAFTVPVWLMVLCSFVMALGTSIGGYRIIKSDGKEAM